MTWLLSAEAEADLSDELAFCRTHASVAVANGFLTEFGRAADVVCASPGVGTPTLKGRRVFPMRRFPYSLIYRVIDGEIRVSAVAHQKRRPAFWKERE